MLAPEPRGEEVRERSLPGRFRKIPAALVPVPPAVPFPLCFGEMAPPPRPPPRRAVHAPAGRGNHARSWRVVPVRISAPARDEGACMQAPHATGHVRYGSARSRGGYGRRDRVGPRDRSGDGSDRIRCGAPGSSCFIRSGGASGQPACPPAKEGGDARGRTIIIDTSRFRGRPGALGAKWAMRAHFCWWLSSACRSTARSMDHSIDR